MELTMEALMSVIGSLGFPIVCCYFLWKYINETMKSFTETMAENTKLLTRICDRLDLLNEEEEK